MGKGDDPNRTAAALSFPAPDRDLFLRMLADVADGQWPAAQQAGAVTLSAQGSAWLRIQSDGSRQAVTGKFLLFSDDPAALFEFAYEHVTRRGFSSAKVSAKPSSMGTHCLCLYDISDKRAAQVQAAAGSLTFRGFKTDADTRAGRYSEQHLASLSPQQRRRVQRRRAAS